MQWHRPLHFPPRIHSIPFRLLLPKSRIRNELIQPIQPLHHVPILQNIPKLLPTQLVQLVDKRLVEVFHRVRRVLRGGREAGGEVCIIAFLEGCFEGFGEGVLEG